MLYWFPDFSLCMISRWMRRLTWALSFYPRNCSWPGSEGSEAGLEANPRTLSSVSHSPCPLPQSRTDRSTRRDIYHTAKKFGFVYIPEKELRAALSPNFHIHVSVSDLKIFPRSVHLFFLQQNRQTDQGNVWIAHRKHECRNWVNQTGYTTLKRKSDLCIRRKGIARPSVPISTFMYLWAI